LAHYGDWDAAQKLFDHFDAAISHAVASDSWQSAELWVRVQKPSAGNAGTLWVIRLGRVI
jgi:hypothetical protein